MKTARNAIRFVALSRNAVNPILHQLRMLLKGLHIQRQNAARFLLSGRQQPGTFFRRHLGIPIHRPTDRKMLYYFLQMSLWLRSNLY